jgi:hypothetical protein
MTEQRMESHRGLHFRLDDGSVYFIRDEVLQACKVSGEELEGAERDLKKGQGKPAIKDSTYIEREMAPLEFAPIGDEKSMAGVAVAPTVMCCW